MICLYTGRLYYIPENITPNNKNNQNQDTLSKITGLEGKNSFELLGKDNTIFKRGKTYTVTRLQKHCSTPERTCDADRYILQN